MTQPLNTPTLNEYPDDQPPRYSVCPTSTQYMSGAAVWHVYRIGQPGIVEHLVCDPDTAARVERVLNAEAHRAARLAAALMLATHEMHPVYGSTAKWHGGIGGQAVTTHCSFLDPAPGHEGMQHTLDKPVREYLDYHHAWDLVGAEDRLREELT